MHTPVLKEASIEALRIKPGGKYIDATYGLGGHSTEIVERGGKVLAFEWDPQSFKREEPNVKDGITLVNENYENIKAIAQKHSFAPCEGIIYDLGLSMAQIRLSGRGFTYEKGDEPLDMRINPNDMTQEYITAEEIINSYSKPQLYEIFTKYSEELSSGAIADVIYNARRIKPITTVSDLIENIRMVTKDPKTVARVFQALRIEVNHEYENIEKSVIDGFEILADDGVMVIITFHPGEDRLVKRIIREHKYTTLQSKQGRSHDKSFERSAHLRIILKN